MVTKSIKALLWPPVQSDVSLSSSATLNAQFWLNQFPWRPTAAWAAVTAMLASGFLVSPLNLDWREMALLLLLVDPIWSSIWRLAAGRTELLPLHEKVVARDVWLPYLQPGSPAAGLLGWDHASALPLLFRVALPTVTLALAVALVLGPTALWLTTVVIVASVIGWIVRHTAGYPPAALHSLATIFLPWMLALNQIGLTQHYEQRFYHLSMVILWSLHNWGEGRVLRNVEDWLGIGLLALADVGVGVLLVIVRAPLWLALLSILWLPTWLALYRRQPLQRLNFWWLLAMLVSGLALGQRR